MGRGKSKTVDVTKLTVKEATWFKLYLDSGNATQSALEVYDTDNYNTAASIASENLRKPKFKNLQRALFDRHGLTEKKLIQKTMKLLDAKKRDGNKMVDDNAVQLGALKVAKEDMGFKSKEDVMTDKRQILIVRADNGEVNINTNEDVQTPEIRRPNDVEE